MKIFYFVFTPIYLFLEGFVLPYLTGFDGLLGKICDWLHFFPFDFGHNSGLIAWCSVLLNYLLWWSVAFYFYRNKKKRWQKNTDLIDKMDEA